MATVKTVNIVVLYVFPPAAASRLAALLAYTQPGYRHSAQGPDATLHFLKILLLPASTWTSTLPRIRRLQVQRPLRDKLAMSEIYDFAPVTSCLGKPS